jgi:hypothetical protein
MQDIPVPGRLEAGGLGAAAGAGAPPPWATSWSLASAPRRPTIHHRL